MPACFSSPASIVSAHCLSIIRTCPVSAHIHPPSPSKTSGYTDEVLLLKAHSDERGSSRWIPLYQASSPSGRVGHSLTPRQNDRDRIFMFGGQRGSVDFDDLWVFDARRGGTWERQRAKGSVPPARHFHASFSVGALFTAFGGLDNAGALCNSDMFVYDPRAGEWTRHETVRVSCYFWS
jgi:hypothetical protein